MKTLKLSVATLFAAALLTGCGTTSNSTLTDSLSALSALNGTTTTPTTSTTTQTTTPSSSSSSSSTSSLLGDLLGTLLGNSVKLSQSSLLGTWSYVSADCVFESENLLLSAGGEVAANKVETKMNEMLAKVGIGVGACTFTFNADNTYTAVLAGRTISGTYELNAEAKTITMTYLSGMATMTPHVVLAGSKLSLLYEADKLLTIINKVGSMTNNASIQTLSSLASSYDGLMIGVELKK